MLELKLAFKNLLGAGLRTWLNVTVLSIAFVVILFYNGMLDGWNNQAKKDTKEWEIGSGQIRHRLYDPFDPYSLQDAHNVIPTEYENNKNITPILVTQATAYPEGRLQNIILKGIEPSQKILKIPSSLLNENSSEITAIIGNRMAESNKLKVGDRLMVRWRDSKGTFDAKEVLIEGIFSSNVPTIDASQIWIPLKKLQEMSGLFNEATYFTVNQNFVNQNLQKNITGNWKFNDEKILLKDIEDVIKAKKAGSMIIYGLLLAISLLAIFDTQVLSIFRRQKEIGTYIALGMTRSRVIRIFTIEGSAHSIFAIILGAIYGTPIFYYINKVGIPMPASSDQMGLAISSSIFPAYSIGLIISSILLVIISSTIVSYFPTRRISRLRPTDAIKGKIQ